MWKVSRVHTLLQNSEDTIHRTEKNDTSFEKQAYFYWKKTKIFFLKKRKSKWLTKRAYFPAPPILIILSQKFHGLVFLLELIDGALTWLNLYGCEAVQRKLKNSLKNTKNALVPQDLSGKFECLVLSGQEAHMPSQVEPYYTTLETSHLGR